MRASSSSTSRRHRSPHRETERLFALIGRLRAAGKSMIYISHILRDVMRLADDIAVLRDGEMVATGPKRDFAIHSRSR